MAKMKIDEASQVKMTELQIAIGGVLVKAEKLKRESDFEVVSPSSIVGIRGTMFEVSVEEIK